MLIIRPIQQDDLDGLMDLLSGSGHGLTSLPKDRDIIKKKIIHSERSFAHRDEGPNGEAYLFVMEDIFKGKIVGVSGIISKIGGFEPYHFYRLKEEEYKSDMLNVNKKIRSLHHEPIHSGPAEICSLYLSKSYRDAQNGRFLSLSRFLFMSEDRKYFEDDVFAEMRGQVDENGESPFWNAVGAKFFDIDFLAADYLTLKSKKFINELLPDYPLIVELLPRDAQDVIAQVHNNTVPARKILAREGFEFSGLVGIFEPGPVLKAKVDDVRTVKENKKIEIGEIVKEGFTENTYIIATSEKDFMACLGQVEIMDDGKARIAEVTATALKIKIGDKIRFSTLRP
jgi:arginine N-succinyltransferase